MRACYFLVSLVAALAVVTNAARVTDISPSSGSIYGGTRLTITGEGFNHLDASQNVVFIGDANTGALCDVIEYYSSETAIVCITEPIAARGVVPVTVQVSGNLAACDEGECKFEYTYDYTPLASSVLPERVEAPASLTVRGSNFAVIDESPGHVDFSMTFGSENERCNLDQDSFDHDDFRCDLQPIASGRQPVNLQLGARGNIKPRELFTQVVPTVNEISPSSGSIAGGQTVTLSGSGFGQKASENQVTLGGAPCAVTKSDRSSLECVTTAGGSAAAASAPTFTAGAVTVEHWAVDVASGSIFEGLVSRDIFSAPTETLTASRFGGSNLFATCSQCATAYTGWFVPERDGNYDFLLKGSDESELWLSEDETPVPYVRDTASAPEFNDRRLLRLSSYSSSYRRSESQALKQGQKYWIRAFAKGSTPSVDVRIEVPTATGRTNITNAFGRLIGVQSAAAATFAVTVNGLEAVCGAACQKNKPAFAFVAAPVVDSIAPTTITAGASVTFTGTGLDRSGALVTVGGATCQVTASTATTLTCTMAQVVGGTFTPVVEFGDFGNAVVRSQVSAAITVTAISPNSGSQYGSTTVEVTGMGFGFDKAAITVTVCAAKCNVQSITNTKITCLTSVSSVATCDVSVTSTNSAVSTLTAATVVFSEAEPSNVKSHLVRTNGLTTGTASIELIVAGGRFNSASDVAVNLVDTTTNATVACPVIYAFADYAKCAAPSVEPSTVNVVATPTGGSAVVVGQYTFENRITSVSMGGFGPNGGNIADIYYAGTNRYGTVAASIGGVPCAKIDSRPWDSKVTCYASNTAFSGSLPTLASYDFTNAATTTQQFWSSGAVRSTSGVTVAKDGFLMTKTLYNAPVRVTAVIRASATYEKDGPSQCIRMRALAADGSSTRTGYEGYLSSGRMGLKIGTWAPSGSKEEFSNDDDTTNIGLTSTKDMTLVLEARDRVVRFYVDGTLIQTLETTSYSAGSVGFTDGCQSFLVKSLKIEDLKPIRVQLSIDGVEQKNTGDDVYFRNAISYTVKSVTSTKVSVEKSFSFELSTYRSTWQLNFYVFPAGTTNFEWTNNVQSLCSSISHVRDTTDYFCKVRDSISAGTYTIIFRDYYGGFIAGSERQFTVLPRVTDTEPSTITTGSTRVTVEGKGFPETTTGLTVSVGGKVCSVVSVSSSSAVCTVSGVAAGDNKPVVVGFSGETADCSSTSACQIDVDASLDPNVTSISPTTVNYAQQQLTISGNGLTRSGTVLIGTAPCRVTWCTSTRMYCTIDSGFSGAAGTANVQVFTSNGLASGSLSVTVSRGTVTDFSPSSGAVGTTLTLRGLGLPTAAPAVTVGGAACGNIEIDGDIIKCTVPAGSGSAAVVVGSTTVGNFDYSTSDAPNATNVFIGTTVAIQNDSPLFVPRGVASAPAFGRVFRPYRAGSSNGWERAGATSAVQYTKAQFAGLTFRFTEDAQHTSCATMIGITSQQDRNGGYTNIDFALYRSNSELKVYESGSHRESFGGGWGANVQYGIRCADASCNRLVYLAGNRIIYTSKDTPQFPITVRVAIGDAGCGVADVKVPTAMPVTEVPVFVAGTQFDSAPNTFVTIAGTTAKALTVTSSFAVISVTAPAVAATYAVSVSNSDHGAGDSKTLASAPFVAGIVHSSGSTNGGQAQAVTGAGLDTATITGCATVSRTSTQVSCTTASAAAAEAPIVADVACKNGACPEYEYKTFNASITSVVPATAAPGSIVEVNVFGSDFSSVSSSFALYAGSNKCTRVSSLSNGVFRCSLATNAVAGSFQATVRTEQFGDSDSIAFGVSLTVSSSAIAIGTTAGTFAIEGEGFDAATASIKDANNAAVCSSITGTSSRLVCSLAALADPVEPLSLTVGSATVALSQVTINPASNPSVTRFDVTANGLAGGDSLVIVGTNLQGLKSVSVGGVNCAFLAKSAASATCRIDGALPAGTAAITSVPASAIGGGVTSTFNVRFAAFSVSPSRIDAAASSTTVTISASGVNTGGAYTVNFGGQVCEVSSLAATSIVCSLGAIPLSLNDEAVTVSVSPVGSVAATGSQLYSYVDVPTYTVTGISPASGTAAGGELVTITGTNFDYNFQYNDVFIGGKRCLTESVNTALTQLVCMTGPAPVNATAAVEVSVWGRGAPVTSGPITFNYFLSVDSVSTESGAGATVTLEGGIPLTITGTGFVQSDQLFVRVGYTACPVTNLTSTQIVCTLPPAPRPAIVPRIFQGDTLSPQLVNAYPQRTAQTSPVSIRINAIDAAQNAAAVVTYSDSVTPIISGVQPAGILKKGDSITLTGTNFLATGNTVVVTKQGTGKVDGCTVTSESTTQIICTLQTTVNGRFRVQVRSPGVGFGSTQSSCPAGTFMMCDGQCLTDADCVRSDWGRSGCMDILELISGDTLCHANGGTDRVRVPMTLDNGKVFNMNCPMYGCEGNDCNTTVQLQGRVSRVSTCGVDPNGIFIEVRASVNSVASVASGVSGGVRLTFQGRDFFGTPSVTLRPFVGAITGDEDVQANAAANTASNSIIAQAAAAASGPAISCRIISSTDTQIVCEVGAGAEGGYSAEVATDGQIATCSNCLTTNATVLSIAATPTVTNVETSTVATAARRITITGTRFSTTAANNDVTLDGQSCAVQSATATQIVCDAPNLEGNVQYDLRVRIATGGYAQIISSGDRKVRIEAVVSSVSPNTASTAGGSVITVNGFGFSTDKTKLSASIGCGAQIISASLSQLVVKINEGSCSGTRSPSVRVNGATYTTCVAASSSSCQVVYGSSSTPSVSSASITGNVLTLNGNFRTSNQADAEVTFSGVTCPLSTFSSTQLSCQVPALPAGTHTSKLFVSGVGFASGEDASKTVSMTITSVFPVQGSRGGGQTVTVQGSGFGTNGTALTVTIAGATCVVTSAASSTLECTTGAVAAEASSVVTVAINENSATSTASYSYQNALTSTVTSITPRRGSTAGGSLLTIAGTSLSKNQVVTIDGVVCVQTTFQQQQTDNAGGNALYCTTGAHATQLEPVDIKIADANGAAAAATATALNYQYVDLWSRRTTWANELPPKEMETIVIPAGKTVMLDVSPPRLHLILVQGHLIFDEEKDLTLEATYIFVKNGRFTIGTWDKPFTKKATIRLYGDRLTPELPAGGAKTLFMQNGIVDIHGVRRSHSWARLADTALAGATQIVINGLVDWVAGEEIVVGSTDFEQLHAEQRTIVSATQDTGAQTTTLVLDRAFRWQHYGKRQCYGTTNPACVDEIAEVSLLSRNVVIEGDADSWKNNIGAQTMFMPMRNDPSTYGRITYTELRNVGRKFALGRYPVHFHISGMNTYSFIKGNAIHHSMNRAMTIHGIQNVTFEDNVVYDTIGHSVFIEMGNEMFNVIRRNVVMVTRACTSCLNQDLTPASFWITNPYNYFYDNVAAGAQFYGFWFAMFERTSHNGHLGETPAGVPINMCPTKMPLGAFEGNIGHSNGNYGINIKPTWTPLDGKDFCSGSPSKQILKGSVIYKNRVHGINTNSLAGSYTFEDLTVADIGTTELEASGLWIELVSAGNYTFGVKGGKFFAFTDNQPYHRSLRRRGINMPRSDNYFTEDVTFVNYVNENWAVEPFRRQCRCHLDYEWGWQHTFGGLRFINAPQKVLLRFRHHAILHDIDGTLGGVAGARLVPDTPFWDTSRCVELTDYQSFIKVMRCEPSYVIRRIGTGYIGNGDGDQNWTIAGKQEIVENLKGKTVVTVPINEFADISYTSFEAPERWGTGFSTRFFYPTERFIFRVLYREPRYSVNVTFNGRSDQNILPVTPTINDAKSGSIWQNETRQITSLMVMPDSKIDWVAKNCPPEGCLPPRPPARVQKPCEPYGVTDSWASGEIGTGDVTITYEDSICLDRTTPGWPNVRFTSLVLEGALHLFDDFCNDGETVTIFVERFVHIRGGEFLIGNDTTRIGKCNVEVILDVVSFDDFEDRSRKWLGPWGSRSFALEYGRLGLYGEKRVQRAYLTANAGVGATQLSLSNAVDWRVGDDIGIAGTTREVIYTFGKSRREESETARVAAVSADGLTVTLESGLQYAKEGALPETLNNTVVVNRGAEIVLLSRKIKFHGSEEDGNVLLDHGWQLNIGCSPDLHEGCKYVAEEQSSFPMSADRPGEVQIDSVLFRDVGQRGKRHGAIEFDGLRGTGDEDSYMKNSAVWNAMNTGVSARHSSDPITIDSNTVFSVYGDAFRVASAANTISNNVAIKGMIPFGHCGNTYMPGNVDCWPGIFRVSNRNYVTNNTAASGVGVGFITEGNDCTFDPNAWKDNVARSTRDGMLVFENPAKEDYMWRPYSFSCRRVGGLTAFAVADMGLALWYVRGDVNVENLNVVDTSIGMSSIILDTSAVDIGATEPRLNVKDSIFKSYFEGQACRNYFYRCRFTKFKDQPWCNFFQNELPRIGNVGILEALFITPQYTSRTPGEKYFMWMEVDSYHSLRGKANYHNIHFDSFDGNDACDRKNLAFYQNFVGNDTVHQHMFSGVTWGPSVKNGGEYWARSAYGPKAGHMTHGVPPIQTVYNDYDNPFIGGLWPDSPNKMWIVDYDGSFTRTGVTTNILSSQTITRESTWASTGWNGVQNVDSIGAVRQGCTLKPEWNAFSCEKSLEFVSLVIENTGRDRLERRVAPVVVCKGDGMIVANGDPICQGGIVDFASGPYMKGSKHKTILQRMSRYRFIVENGGNYTLLFRSTPPESMRFRLTNWEYLNKEAAEIGVVLNFRVFGANSQSRLGVFVDGRKEFPIFGYGYPHQYGLSWPGPFDRAGTHYHDRYIEPLLHRNVMSFSVRPNVNLELKHESVVQVSMMVAMPLRNFYNDQETFVAALIELMGIPDDTVRIVKIVPGTSRRQGGETTNVVIESTLATGNGAMTASETNDLAAKFRQLNIAALSARFGSTVSVVSVDAIIPAIEVRPVTVAPGSAYVLVNVEAAVFSTDVLDDHLVTFVRENGNRPIHANATGSDVFSANSAEIAELTYRVTFHCVFTVEEGNTEAGETEDNRSDNAACVRRIYDAIVNNEAAIQLNGYRFLNVTFELNGAVPENPTQDSDKKAVTDNLVVLVVVVVIVVLVFLAIFVGVVVYYRRRTKQAAKNSMMLAGSKHAVKSPASVASPAQVHINESELQQPAEKFTFAAESPREAATASPHPVSSELMSDGEEEAAARRAAGRRARRASSIAIEIAHEDLDQSHEE